MSSHDRRNKKMPFFQKTYFFESPLTDKNRFEDFTSHELSINLFLSHREHENFHYEFSGRTKSPSNYESIRYMYGGIWRLVENMRNSVCCGCKLLFWFQKLCNKEIKNGWQKIFRIFHFSLILSERFQPVHLILSMRSVRSSRNADPTYEEGQLDRLPRQRSYRCYGSIEFVDENNNQQPYTTVYSPVSLRRKQNDSSIPKYSRHPHQKYRYTWGTQNRSRRKWRDSAHDMKKWKEEEETDEGDYFGSIPSPFKCSILI